MPFDWSTAKSVFDWGSAQPVLPPDPLPSYYGPTGTETTTGMQTAGPTDYPARNVTELAARLAQQTGANPIDTTLGMVGGIKAFHGSPHDFGAFDLSKIGAGEGTQAFGHGLYFAENEAVSESYRDNLGGGSGLLRVTPQTDAEREVQQILREGASQLPGVMSLEDARAWVQSAHDPWDDRGLLDALSSIEERAPKGHMYEVDLNADPAHMLDWDKPINQQPEVLARLANHPDADLINEAGHQITGQTLWDILRAGPQGPSGATQGLRESGIPGIKYLDAGSRSAGAGTSNYVVFDDKMVNILRKYGLAGLIAGGTGALPQIQPPGAIPPQLNAAINGQP